jgi:hypothetical protein
MSLSDLGSSRFSVKRHPQHMPVLESYWTKALEVRTAGPNTDGKRLLPAYLVHRETQSAGVQAKQSNSKYVDYIHVS